MLITHFASASKPSVLPRLHSSTNASTLNRASLRRSQQQRRGFRSVVQTSYYHRITNTTSRDTDILNRRLMLSRQAGIPISFRVAGIAGTVVCERKAAAEVDLQKLKHDSNQAAVYVARTTTFTSYKPISKELRSPQSYIAERNASRRIPGFNSKKTRNSNDTKHAIPVKTFGGSPQFEEFKQPVASLSAGNLLFNKPPGMPAPSGAATYVTDSELYLDGRTLEQELNPYYKPVKAYEPDGLPVDAVCPIQEALLEYDAKPNVDYNGFGYNEPDGKPTELPCSVEESLHDYDQTAKYDDAKPFTFNEPDGLPDEPVCEVESALNQYDQKTTYDGARPFTFNEPDGLPIEAVSEVESALSEYDLKKEANGYQPFGHNEPNGQPAQKVDPTRAALREYDQKWEPKIENDNFFFDEDFQKEIEEVARTAPIVASKTDDASMIKDEAALIGSLPIRKVASGSSKSRRETEERMAHRGKLESNSEKSSTKFVKDVEVVRKTVKARPSRDQLKEFEGEASVLLNQYHHLRGKIDARLEELAEEDRKAEFVNEEKLVSTGGTALNDTIQSAAIIHPLKSGIDFRRKDTMFSGPKGDRRWKRKQRRGSKVGTVVGAAAAGAGVFYAAGVVSEFFSTGGSEGTGAVGL